MVMHIRKEEEKDFRRVEEIARDAFWNLYFPGAHEHYVVHKMRQHEDFIADLSHVIEVDGTVQGAIFYTHSHIACLDGSVRKTISFGPVFIAPKYHRQGLGRALITHTMALAKAMGHAGMLVLGYPYHYEPYGFVGGKKYGISMGDGNFYTGLLAYALQEDGLTACAGQAVFSNVFEVAQGDVDAFDATFPFKEKAFQESQVEFEKACAELDVS